MAAAQNNRHVAYSSAVYEYPGWKEICILYCDYFLTSYLQHVNSSWNSDSFFGWWCNLIPCCLLCMISWRHNPIPCLSSCLSNTTCVGTFEQFSISCNVLGVVNVIELPLCLAPCFTQTPLLRLNLRNQICRSTEVLLSRRVAYGLLHRQNCCAT